MRYGGRYNLLKIRKWLYRQSFIFMERKKERFYSFSRREIKGSSKYNGVSWGKKNNKWNASIFYNKKAYNLGSFDKEVDAAKAFDKFILDKKLNKYRSNFLIKGKDITCSS